MLKNYVSTTTKDTEITLCTPSDGCEISVLSIIMNGGENGGTVKLSLSNGFDYSFSLDAQDVVILDNKLNLPNGVSLKATADAHGGKICVSAAEMEVM